MSTNEIVVSVENVSKSFRIPTESSNGIKQKLINFLKGRKGYREFTPLDNVSFTINKGDFFGIVGRNGSGKSTLLKTIAGIYTPNKGLVSVSGTLVPFIELGVGFNPELTGRENVFLNGALLGFSRTEMHAMYDGIVEFAELEDFMDEKLKNYSSGMQVRLAFSIAIRANGDILMLDEVLAVGDSNFQKKCIDYFKQLKRDKKTVILVTHDMGSVERFCNKAILIDGGKIVAEGSPTKITQKYSDINFDSSANDMTQTIKGENPNKGKKGISVGVNIKGSSSGINVVDSRTDDKVIIEYKVKKITRTEDLKIGTIIFNSDNIPIFATNTEVNELRLDGDIKSFTVNLEIDNIFSNGEYYVSVGVTSTEGAIIYYTTDRAGHFIAGGRKHEYAVASPRYKMVMSK